MKNMNFTPNFYVVNANVNATSAQGAENGDAIDVSQADCITAVVELGAAGNTATGTVHLEERDSTTGSWTAVPQASISFAGNSDDAISDSDDTFVVELAKPTMRYARVVITRATAGTAIVGGHYLLGGLRYTQGTSSTINSATNRRERGDGSFEFTNYPLTGNAKTHVTLTVGGTDSDTHTNPKA